MFCSAIWTKKHRIMFWNHRRQQQTLNLWYSLSECVCASWKCASGCCGSIELYFKCAHCKCVSVRLNWEYYPLWQDLVQQKCFVLHQGVVKTYFSWHVYFSSQHVRTFCDVEWIVCSTTHKIQNDGKRKNRVRRRSESSTATAAISDVPRVRFARCSTRGCLYSCCVG